MNIGDLPQEISILREERLKAENKINRGKRYARLFFDLKEGYLW